MKLHTRVSLWMDGMGRRMLDMIAPGGDIVATCQAVNVRASGGLYTLINYVQSDDAIR